LRVALIARNSLWTALDQGLSFLGGTVVAIIIARVLGPTLLGAFAFVMWIVGVGGSLGIHGVSRATGKFGGEYFGRGEPEIARAIIRSALRWQLAVGSILVGIGLVAVWVSMPADDFVWGAVAVVSLLATMIMAIAARGIEIRQDFRLNVIPSILGNTVNIVGSLVVLWRGWGLLGLTSALLLSRVVDAVVRQALFRSSWADVTPGAIPPELRRRFARFATQASGLLVLSIVVWDRSEVFFLEWYCDFEAVAFYSLSFGIMKSLLIFPHSLNVASGANLLVEYGRDPRKQGQFAGRMTVFLALAAFPLTLGMSAVSGPAIRVLYGEAYLPAIPVLAIVAAFAVPQALLAPAQFLLVAHERQKFLLAWGAIVAVVNLSLDLILIPKGAAIGAAIANATAQSLALVGIWFYASRHVGLVLPVRSIARVGVSAVVMALGAFAVTRSLPPLSGLVLGILTGVLLYPLSLRLTGSLGSEDRERLLEVSALVPPRLRPAYAGLINLVAG
jgi:O-antigen/teichoic acid export membrane protein